MTENASDLWGEAAADDGFGVVAPVAVEEAAEAEAVEAQTYAEEVAALRNVVQNEVAFQATRGEEANGVDNMDQIAVDNMRPEEMKIKLAELEMKKGTGNAVESSAVDGVRDEVSGEKESLAISADELMNGTPSGQSQAEREQAEAIAREKEELKDSEQISFFEGIAGFLSVAGFGDIAAGFAGLFNEDTERDLADIRSTMSEHIVGVENLGNGVDGAQLDVAVAQGLTSEAARQSPAVAQQGQGVVA